MILSILGGIGVNVILSWAVYYLELPLYMDTIGTVFVTAAAGLFPGIMTSVATSLFCSIFNDYSIYYTIVGVMIAHCTSWFVESGGLRRISRLMAFAATLSLVGGVLGTGIQWILLGGPQFPSVAEVSELIAGGRGIGYFFVTVLIGIGLNLVDKGVSAAFALLLMKAVSPEILKEIRESSWQQKPLSREYCQSLKKKGYGSRSLQFSMFRLMIFATASLTFVLCWISIRVYNQNIRAEYEQNARNAARFAAEVVDADRIPDYLREGKEAEGYAETERMLYRIRDNASGVQFLYVLKVEKDYCTYIFDLDTPEVPAYLPGDREEVEEAFEPYMPDLLSGREIPSIESDDLSGWLLTAYCPVRNSAGVTVCYAAADVSMHRLTGYVRGFLIRVLLIFTGFFVLILGYGIWYARYHLIYPIGSMTEDTSGFLSGDLEPKDLDRRVKKLKSLDIHTGGEVEALYDSILQMASGMTDQMKAVRYYADATSQMQNGLIMTMADMVENRDSDTGAHIRKTAEYVKIILAGLKKKGYYAGRLTPRYISDVIMSAPLHDVGKIQIPDSILNKPGKLTEEEFEIMKTHASVGKHIMENAISTLQGENYLKEARNMAAYHHERWDGKGYPERLKGEVIPLSARIMAVADVFDALTSPRVYKPGFPLEKALQIIRDGAGVQFDPKIVEVFLEALPEVKAVLKKYQE